MTKHSKAVALLLLFLSAFAAGCSKSEPPALLPPAGWEGTQTLWWQEGVDTTGLFREMETLQDMQVVSGEKTYAASIRVAEESGIAQQQLLDAVKRSLIQLYRNDPQVIDSLFELFVAPEIRQEALAGDVGEFVGKFKKRGYELVRSHFQEPMAAKSLGTDIPVPYPDSLQKRQIEGAVRMQAYVNEEGEPLAIMLLMGVHPVLDHIAMQATTKMRWRPAYLIVNRRWQPHPAWVRYNINFAAPDP